MLIFLFGAWSMANLVLHGSIFKPFRDWVLVNAPIFGKLLTCMMCFSFWSSLLLCLLINGFDGTLLFSNHFIDILIGSLCGSGFSYLLDLIIWKTFINQPTKVIKKQWKRI